jgi:hypothetical protein
MWVSLEYQVQAVSAYAIAKESLQRRRVMANCPDFSVVVESCGEGWDCVRLERLQAVC